jgi:hypothetical protein
MDLPRTPKARAFRQWLLGLGLLFAGVVLGRYTAPGLGQPRAEEPSPVAESREPRYLEATVYLPLDDNDGKPFAEKDWHAALERLVARFGGATLGEPQQGLWLDGSKRVHRERVRPVVVSFAPQRLDEFRSTLHDVGQHLGQEAIYARYGEPCVELIPVVAVNSETTR